MNSHPTMFTPKAFCSVKFWTNDLRYAFINSENPTTPLRMGLLKPQLIEIMIAMINPTYDDNAATLFPSFFSSTSTPLTSNDTVASSIPVDMEKTVMYPKYKALYEELQDTGVISDLTEVGAASGFTKFTLHLAYTNLLHLPGMKKFDAMTVRELAEEFGDMTVGEARGTIVLKEEPICRRE